MRCLPNPANPGPGRWGRARRALVAVAAAALVVQVVPVVHTALVVLVVTSWVLIALLAARALAHRYGLQLPAWASPTVATRIVPRLAGWSRTCRRSTSTPGAAPVPAGQDCYELVGGPVGGQR